MKYCTHIVEYDIFYSNYRKYDNDRIRKLIRIFYWDYILTIIDNRFTQRHQKFVH